MKVSVLVVEMEYEDYKYAPPKIVEGLALLRMAAAWNKDESYFGIQCGDSHPLWLTREAALIVARRILEKEVSTR